ncbi:O-antigen translocase [Pedobacter rhodius]|uniref:O-antigen translocase n=1 Tax=Pedobacter rhodius TaxID=3004098 RepID=A0ABT4KZM4_9SPHI|nr:O-antigen translocase [Pedobacter sp. SJ11]MCZ4224374.1 O-antigen translocase [Pedobacter sp. SJ11]
MMDKEDSYKQIAKSTGVVGGTQILNILIGIVRMKVLAILLGPSGVGIAGIFQTIVDLVKDATGFGINFSGVKKIAEVSESRDPKKISRNIKVLRRWALGTGLFGTFIIIGFSQYFSIFSFGNSDYTRSIIFLSIIVFTSTISASQIALLQGLRKISEMAKANLFGTIAGTVVSLPLYWWFGNKGIVPGMVLTSICAMCVSWIFSRKIKIQHVDLTISQSFKDGLGMAKLGFFIVVNGFVATLSMYIIRKIIISHLSLTSVGFFQAVWTISTVYINVLLHAMLADYFPRLTMLQNDNQASNKLINQQLEVTLLIGTPMLIGMIVMAPIGLNILYSASFDVAVPILRWQMAGSFFTLLSWPLGVLYLSKNEGWYCVISESLRQLFYISFVYFAWKYFGFNSLGIGFLLAGVVNVIFVYFSLKKISGFKFSLINIKFIIIFGTAVISILSLCLLFNGWLTYLFSFGVVLLFTIFCFKKLDQLIGIKQIIVNKFSLKNN